MPPTHRSDHRRNDRASAGLGAAVSAYLRGDGKGLGHNPLGGQPLRPAFRMVGKINLETAIDRTAGKNLFA